MYFLEYQVRFDSGFQLGLIAFTAAVLGGIGNLPGQCSAPRSSGFIQSFNEGLLWYAPGSDWTRSIVFAILIADPRLPPGGAARGADAGGRVTSLVDRARGYAKGDRERWLVPALVLLGLLYPWYVDTLKSLPVIGDFVPLDRVDGVMVAFTMMALGLNIVVGYAGLLDLGYVAFYAVGAYTAGWFASQQFARSTSTSSRPSRARSREST